MINQLLYNLYKKNNYHWRLFLRKIVLKTEKGEFYSKTLRKIFFDYHNIQIDMYSYGCFHLDRVPPNTIIGKYCSFARDFFITFGNHPVNFKSTHPFFYNPDLGVVDELLIKRTEITIENDVWIGKAALILPGVKNISNGAVIGAGSVVANDVPPYAVVAGNPAKIIKYRFSDKTINLLLKKKWWELSIEDIKNDGEIIKEFIHNKINNNKLSLRE